MSFEAALKTIAAEIDAALDRLLPASGRLAQAMRYAAMGRGKRLRPFFVVESAALFGVPRARTLRTAAAVECIHCYSLVHDDLPAMDDDDLRRGQPTVHRKFDEATAILVGDALQSLAFEILGDRATHEDGHVRAELVAALGKASGADGMAGGQMLDILAETGSSHDIDSVVAMQSLKTGALFRFSCLAGAMLGGGSQGERAALALYGDRIGLAFQIADDVLDVESSQQALGKAAQKDKAQGKATFVDLLGLVQAKARAASLVDEAIAALAPFGDRAALLRDAAGFIIARRR